jgi:hypothetical protein
MPHHDLLQEKLCGTLFKGASADMIGISALALRRKTRVGSET